MRFRIFGVAAVLAAMLALPAFAADYHVQLKSRGFTPDALADVSAALGAAAGHRVVVQLDSTPNAATRAAYAAHGITLLVPLSGNTWIARIDARDFGAKENLGVRWVGALRATDKIQASVRDGRFPEWSAKPQGRRVVSVTLLPDVTEAAGRALLSTYGRVIERTNATNAYDVEIDTDDIMDLAAREEVQWIESPLPVMSPNMDVAKPAVGGDVANEDYGVSGEGIRVFILDGGVVLNSFHDDLKGRITVIGLPIPDILIGHATNVMGIVGGDGTVSGGQYVGIAPKVTFVSATALPLSIPPLYNSPASIEGQYKTAIQQEHVNVSNNSIGANLAEFGTLWCDREGDYEGTAALIDKLVGGLYGPITIVWANGNERGYEACGTYATVPPPAGAKNSIAVGAVNKDTLGMTFFSSYGPTDDGRLRPDVSAPGCVTDGSSFESGITATGPGNRYISFCGTSQASPIVTGSAALVQEYWLKAGHAELPWASTVKALLIHGSLDEDEPGPNYRYGYGVVQIPDSLDLIDNAWIKQSTIDQGDELNFEFAATGPVKATLVWTDPAGPLLTAKALVNDLDLSVRVENDDLLPYLLDPETPSAAAGTGENHRDPVEQVAAAEADDGDYVRVRVNATDVPQGPQSYTLIVSGVTDWQVDDDEDDDTSDDDTGDDDTTDDDFGAGDDDDDDDDDSGGCGC